MLLSKCSSLPSTDSIQCDANNSVYTCRWRYTEWAKNSKMLYCGL